jgi:hypothetical protein
MEIRNWEGEATRACQFLFSSFQFPVSIFATEDEMAKNLKLKCLTDDHIEKHGLDLCDKGKIGVFDGDELVGMADDIAGWQPKPSKKELSEIFASEVGMPGKSLAEIALVAKLVQEQPVDHFAALS